MGRVVTGFFSRRIISCSCSVASIDLIESNYVNLLTLSILIVMSSNSMVCVLLFILAELSIEQIVNLRRREALAYESDVFEQANKEKRLDLNWQDKLDAQLRQLRQMISLVKITCEATSTNT
jgi:hypothetical protein